MKTWKVWAFITAPMCLVFGLSLSRLQGHLASGWFVATSYAIIMAITLHRYEGK